jgi:hypothetical protein
VDIRPLLEQLDREEGAALFAALAYLAAEEMPIDRDELRGARRRALLILAAGGDPRRELDVDAGAVTRLAADLDTPELRGALRDALGDLHARATDLPAVAAALEHLLAEEEAALRWLAAALLAEELAGEE